VHCLGAEAATSLADATHPAEKEEERFISDSVANTTSVLASRDVFFYN